MFFDFASDSVLKIGLLGTSSGTQWVILLYWVPPDRFLLRFCDTDSDAELSSHPVKGWFARTAELKNVFHPVKGWFARTKLLIAEVQAQASRHIELGAALVSSVYSMLKAPFHFLQQSSYVVARGKSLCLRSQQKTPFGRALLSDEMVPSIVAEDGIVLNPKNTFEQQPHSTAFWLGYDLKVYEIAGHLRTSALSEVSLLHPDPKGVFRVVTSSKLALFSGTLDEVRFTAVQIAQATGLSAEEVLKLK